MGKQLGMSVFCIIAAALLAGCGKRAGKTAQADSEAASTAQVQKIEKSYAGVPVEGSSSLYDATGIYEKEGYQIIDIQAYGDSSIAVIYGGITDSVMSLYSVTGTGEIKSIKLDNVSLSPDAVINIPGSNLVYVYDADGNTFYYFDMEQGSYTSLKAEFEADCVYVSETGSSIYYTRDGIIYSYAVETGSSEALYSFEGDAESVYIRSIEAKTGNIIIRYESDNSVFYAGIDAATGELKPLDGDGGELYYIGEVYVTVPSLDEAYVNVYNADKPRITEKFYLDDVRELKCMKLYNGNPYLLTMVDETGGTMMRFYSLSRGIMNNEVLLPEKYKVTDTSYLTINQTLCIEVVSDGGEKGLVFWDMEAVKTEPVK